MPHNRQAAQTFQHKSITIHMPVLFCTLAPTPSPSSTCSAAMADTSPMYTWHFCMTKLIYIPPFPPQVPLFPQKISSTCWRARRKKRIPTLGYISTRVALFLSPPLSESFTVNIASDPSRSSGRFLRKPRGKRHTATASRRVPRRRLRLMSRSIIFIFNTQ